MVLSNTLRPKARKYTIIIVHSTIALERSSQWCEVWINLWGIASSQSFSEVNAIPLHHSIAQSVPHRDTEGLGTDLITYLLPPIFLQAFRWAYTGAKVRRSCLANCE